MTTIGDSMRSLIRIFNQHAGNDKLLSKAELRNMMNKGKFMYQYLSPVWRQKFIFCRIKIKYSALLVLFSEEQAAELMGKLDKDDDGSITFEEFVGEIAEICDLFNISINDSSDEGVMSAASLQQVLEAMEKDLQR